MAPFTADEALITNVVARAITVAADGSVDDDRYEIRLPVSFDPSEEEWKELIQAIDDEAVKQGTHLRVQDVFRERRTVLVYVAHVNP